MDTGSGARDRGAESLAGRFDPADAATIAVAYARIRARMDHACRRANRESADVRLVGVSKTIPAERLRAAVAVGVGALGENRVQDASEKADLVPGAMWHLIGPLQSNKARRAVAIFATIDTVDSIDLAVRLDHLVAGSRAGDRFPVLLQVNVDDDPAKAGFGPTALGAALPGILALPNLRISGLMTVGRLVNNPLVARTTFVALRELSERLRADLPSLGPELSMGMSDDFEIAIEEGATIVRVGRALFGARPSVVG